MNNREEALKWWNSLASLRKTQLCDTNTDIAGSVRRWETLTGREIEKIWQKEVIKMDKAQVLKDLKSLRAKFQQVHKYYHLSDSEIIKENFNEIVGDLEEYLNRKL